MCGIAGAAGKDSETLVRKMLEVLKHRGPDSSGIYSSDDLTVGNVLLKITGDKTQPIHNHNVLTYNGEIYNFKGIAAGLDLATGSDSETLFHLIEKKGVEGAILELDGDYAFACINDGKIYLARDPLGVKPLYYSKCEDFFAFASEKKALLSIGMDDIDSLLPGHLLSYTGGGFSDKKIMGFSPGEKINDENTASKILFDAIDRAVKKRNYKPCAIAFSGGLDSSLIAALSQEPELYSVGMKGSHDIQQTEKAARLLGLSDKLNLHELTEEEVRSAIPEVIKAIESCDPLMVSIALPLYLVSKYAHNEGIRVMLSGQGADELFAGYKRYESMGPVKLEMALRKDLDNIAVNNLERDDAVTMANSVELRVPYLDKNVIDLAIQISPELKIKRGIRKFILRKVALQVLPQEIACKEKKAAQYSSGIYSTIKKLAKKNGHQGSGFVGRYLKEIEI